jgi:hypothetical protein
MGTSTYGYSTESDIIAINAHMVDDGDLGELGKVIDTMTHEMRHQFQDEVTENPSLFDIPPQVVQQWRENDVNYISGDDDFEGYYKQPLEVDARSFAERVMQLAGLGLPIRRVID